MAAFDSELVRLTALEAKRRTLQLYMQLAPLLSTVNAWGLNGDDSALPLPYDVKTALTLFQGLKLKRLVLTEEGDLLAKAQPGDTLL
jgi:hypothetical protein